MEKIILDARKREAVGKQAAKSYRREGLVPGNYYAFGQESTPVLVEHKKVFAILDRQDAGSVMIDIRIAGAGEGAQTAIIREVQHDPVSGELLHIDFQGISMTREINLEIPVHLSGTAVGVKSKGGILEHALRQIEISCLPTEIPAEVRLDISSLDIGDSIHVRDIRIPNAEILTDTDRVLVTVVPPVVVREVEAAEEEAVVEGAEAAEAAEAEEGPEEQ